MPYDSRRVAQRFFELAQAASQTLTPMQLIKLTYIAHGWMLGLYHRALVRDEVQAWQYGPVIPQLYKALRKYKGKPVTAPIADDSLLDPQAEHLIRQVFERYGRLSGPRLSDLTHRNGTPWSKTYEPGRFGSAIPDDLIEDHYSRLAGGV